MPWKETCAMTEKLKFIAACAEGDEKESFAALCRRFGISRKTGYKWLSRYEEGGAAGLEEKERGVREVEHRLSEELVSRVIEARKSHPKWGPKKLRAWLGEHEGVEGLPSASTIGEWLKRYGLVRPRRRRLRVPLNPNALDKCQMPNDVWCIDFKGHFALGDKKRCYPLTLTDAASRYILCCEALLKTDAVAVRPHIERAFLEFGLPRKIRSDNGPPFATVGVGGLSALSVWWIRLGIEPERIEPGHPEQNGRHERMHRTLKDEPASEPGRNLANRPAAPTPIAHRPPSRGAGYFADAGSAGVQPAPIARIRPTLAARREPVSCKAERSRLSSAAWAVATSRYVTRPA